MLITGSLASLCINAFISSELEQGHNSHNIRPHSNHNMTGRKQLIKNYFETFSHPHIYILTWGGSRTVFHW